MAADRTLPAVRQAAPAALIGDIRRMIEETRLAVAVTVNAGLKMLNFAGAFPDEAIVSTLSRQLGWSHFNYSFADFLDRAALRAGQRKTACLPKECVSHAHSFRRSRPWIL